MQKIILNIAILSFLAFGFVLPTCGQKTNVTGEWQFLLNVGTQQEPEDLPFRIVIGKANALPRKTIEIRCLDVVAAVAGQITVTQVVCQNEHDVGAILAVRR